IAVLSSMTKKNLGALQDHYTIDPTVPQALREINSAIFLASASFFYTVAGRIFKGLFNRYQKI
ncbi:MAG: hypothetical protein ACK46A_07530, partial [Akkermansiaceae bacterium]